MIAISSTPRKNPAIRPSEMPTATEIATTAMPIDSESRAPYMSRERMSRPMASVPSRCVTEPPSCQAGGRRKALLSVWLGACGAIHGANSATSSRNTTTPRPMTAPRLAENEPQNSRHGPGGAVPASRGTVVVFMWTPTLGTSCPRCPPRWRALAWGGPASSSSRLPDTRVDEAVGQIDHDVDHHHDDAEQQHASLQHGI